MNQEMRMGRKIGRRDKKGMDGSEEKIGKERGRRGDEKRRKKRRGR